MNGDAPPDRLPVAEAQTPPSPPPAKPPVDWAFIEVTSVCNMRCDFCPSPRLKRPRKLMSWDVFKAAADQIAELGLKLPVQFQVMGEPTLHPEIWRYLDYCAEKGLRVLFFTNGAHIDRHIAEICKRDNIEALVISLQTPDAESYRLRHFDKPFDEYKAGVVAAVRHIVETETFRKMGTQIHIANTKFVPWSIVNENAQAVRTLEEMDAAIRPLWPYPWEERESIPPNILDLLDSEYWGYKVLPGIWIRYKRFCSFGGTFETGEVTDPRKCPMAESSICVLSDGSISLCCMDAEGETSVGNISEISLREALASTRRARILENVTRVPACRRCLAGA